MAILQKLLSFLNTGPTETEDTVLVSYEVKLSCKTEFQIWFRDNNNIPKLIRKNSDSYVFSMAYPAIENQIELLVFVKNKKLLSDQIIELSIKIEGVK